MLKAEYIPFPRIEEWIIFIISYEKMLILKYNFYVSSKPQYFTGYRSP